MEMCLSGRMGVSELLSFLFCTLAGSSVTSMLCIYNLAGHSVTAEVVLGTATHTYRVLPRWALRRPEAQTPLIQLRPYYVPRIVCTSACIEFTQLLCLCQRHLSRTF